MKWDECEDHRIENPWYWTSCGKTHFNPKFKMPEGNISSHFQQGVSVRARVGTCLVQNWELHSALQFKSNQITSHQTLTRSAACPVLVANGTHRRTTTTSWSEPRSGDRKTQSVLRIQSATTRTISSWRRKHSQPQSMAPFQVPKVP